MNRNAPRRRPAPWWLTAVSLLLAVPAAARAQDVQKKDLGNNLVEVTVTAGGVDKDDAIRQAMRKALEEGAGTYIHSQSEVKDFVLIRDTILTRATGFIQSHEVLDEKELPDKTWQVKIKAVVSVQGVMDTWGAVTTLLQQMGRPKIMVVIREKIGDDVQDSSTVQTRIERELLKSGFELVDQAQIKAIDQKDLSAAVAEDKPDKLQAIAKRFGAQIFLTGTVECASGRDTRVGDLVLRTFEAIANIRIFNSDTAKLLSSYPGQPTRGVDRVWRSAANMALDKQGQQAAPVITGDLLRVWTDAVQGRGEVVLEVEKISFAQYVDLKKKLAKVKEVKDVTANFASGVARCSIQSDVKAETLAEKLLEAAPELEITDVSQNVIKATRKGAD